MRRLSRTLAVVALAGAAVAAQAQTPDAPAIDPGSMAALQSMGAYLRTLKSFWIEVRTTDEDVLEDGQKIQYSGTTSILARMPDGLRAEVANDRYERMYLYDGKTFTLFAKRLNYYATVPAPPTIGELARTLDEEYDVGVPVVDFFRWGTPDFSTDGVTGAMDVGPSVVDGVTCQQYAFRQADIDWQIWIQKGDYPLPRRLVITTTTDEARPQHTAEYVWNLAPSYNDAAFVFDPPADAGQVTLAGAAGAAGADSK